MPASAEPDFWEGSTIGKCQDRILAVLHCLVHMTLVIGQLSMRMYTVGECVHAHAAPSECIYSRQVEVTKLQKHSGST